MRVELIPIAQHPLVYGERLRAPSKSTVLLYGHFDVQPVSCKSWRMLSAEHARTETQSRKDARSIEDL